MNKKLQARPSRALKIITEKVLAFDGCVTWRNAMEKDYNARLRMASDHAAECRACQAQKSEKHLRDVIHGALKVLRG